MPDDQLEVSVIVCAYTMDRWKDLQLAIQSLQDQTVLPSEIILVIDHNPALFSIAREAFPCAKVIENQDELGLSGARNSGIAQSRGQVIAFMDEDAVAASNWIEILLNGYQNPRVIGVGGNVRPVWTELQPDWLPEEFFWVVGCSYKGLPESTAPVRNPIGCSMSFRRSALISAGGFRNGIGRIDTIPLGCEETELSIRIRQLNPTSSYLYQPEAIVFHKVPKWRENWKYFVRRCYAEGLSKALVARFVGSSDGLSSERRYVIGTLTRGAFNGLTQALFHGTFAGLKHAAAIVVGLLLTTAGFVVGVITRINAKSSLTLESENNPSDTTGPALNRPYFQPVEVDAQNGKNANSQRRSLD